MPAFDLAGRSMAYGDSGRGPAVVLIHGLLMDRSVFEAQTEALSDSYRVVTPEAPGHGDSDSVEVGYDFEDLATDVWTLLDGIGVSEAVFGGQSFGGWTSLRCAVQRPAATRGLIFIDSSAGPENPDLKAQYEAFLNVALADGVSEDLANILLMILFSSTFAATAAAEPWHKKMVEEDPNRIHALSRAVFDRPDVGHLLPKVTCPALIIHGEEDMAIGMERAEELSAALKAPLHRIPSAGHASNHEQPEIVTPIIRSFLDSL